MQSVLCESLRILRGTLCNSYFAKEHKGLTKLRKEFRSVQIVEQQQIHFKFSSYQTLVIYTMQGKVTGIIPARAASCNERKMYNDKKQSNNEK